MVCASKFNICSARSVKQFFLNWMVAVGISKDFVSSVGVRKLFCFVCSAGVSKDLFGPVGASKILFVQLVAVKIWLVQLVSVKFC